MNEGEEMSDTQAPLNGYSEICLNGKFYNFMIYNLSDQNLPEAPGIFMISGFDVFNKPVPFPCPYFVYHIGMTTNLNSEIANSPDWDDWLRRNADMIFFAQIDNYDERKCIHSLLSTACKDD